MLPVAFKLSALLRQGKVWIVSAVFLGVGLTTSNLVLEAYQAQRPQVSDVPQLTVIASKSSNP